MTLRELWTLSRPPTLPASVVPVAVGVAAALLRGPVQVGAVVLMAAVALLLQIATNMANEYADFRRGVDAADSVGIAGSLVHGRLTPAAVRRLALATYGAAFLLGLVLVFWRGPVMLALGVAGILAGYF
ncbi:MAG: 1,4-dihydroxy-2-naphthoate octaprenyltransferase, partial [Clostridia bacterium]